MSKDNHKSLYNYIAEAVDNGKLPDKFSLPRKQTKNEIMWMDGALDGVNIYHMGFSKITDENRTVMTKAVRAAAEKKFDEADRLFCDLGQKVRAIVVIDELQSYIIDHKDELSAKNLYDYAVHAIVDSSDRECVKFGLSLLELFDTDNHENLKNIVRTLGLSDEFSLFAIFVMLRWNNGNDEVYQLAKKIHGWGRIHAIERIEPQSDEIKDWLLKDGVHNTVLSAYSALDCWQKSGAESVLKAGPSKEEFSGIRDIIEGLLDEGPVRGISEIENSADVLTAFLNQAKRMHLHLADYEVIREIRIHCENDNAKNSAVAALCYAILDSDGCKSAVKEAVKEGKSIGLAQDLHLDYKADVLHLLKTKFDEKYYLCNLLMEDAEYRLEILEIFRQNLPLDQMKTSPTDYLGLGEDYKQQHQLESIVQELWKYPFEGIEFIETALQSEPIRTRNCGLNVLESWVSTKATPLKELLPDIYILLCRLCDIEVKDDVKKRMNRLIAGSIVFSDKPNNNNNG